MSKNARIFLTSMFLTNIGNGLYILAVSKALFDLTHSVLGFGIVLISEFVLKFLLQGIAGYLVDRKSPIKICLFSDLFRFLFFTIAAFVLINGQSLVAFILTTFAVNFFKPFYISAAFSLATTFNSPDSLEKYNSSFAALKQGGFLLGILFGGLMLAHLSVSSILAIDALSYLASALILLTIKVTPTALREETPNLIESVGSKIYNDWKVACAYFFSTSSIRWAMLRASVDPLVLYFLTIALVPLVDERFSGNPKFLAILQGAFVIGTVCGSQLTGKFLRLKQHRKSASFAALFFAQLMMLWLLSPTQTGPLLTIVLLAALGALNVLSFSFHYNHLQRSVPDGMKGKISSLYLALVSVLLAIFVGGVAKVMAHSLEQAFQLSAVTVFLLGIVSVSRKFENTSL